MASPYFTPIQTKTADYSPIVQAGQAEGEMYASIGKALGSVASTYFRKEKTKTKAKLAVENGGADAILANAGFDEESRKSMSPEDKLKVITGAIDEVGLENFQRTQMQMTQQRQTAANQELLLQQNEIVLAGAQRAETKYKRMDEISKHYYRQNKDGDIAFNLDGFQNWNEYAAEIGEFAKGRNMGKGFSSANFASFMESSNVDPTDKRAVQDVANQWIAMTGGDSQEHERVLKIAESRYIDPMDIQKDFSDYLNSDPSIKGIMEAQTSFEAMGAKLPEAFQLDENGVVNKITNTTALMDFRRALAKIGNGAGVMTDKDVDDYMGETDVLATISRKFQAWFGDGSEEGKSALLSVEDAEQLNRLYKVTREFHDNKARKAYREGIISVDRKYRHLNRRKVMHHLSPKFTEGMLGTEEGIREGAASVNELNVDPDVAQAIRRDLANNKSYQEVFDSFREVNPDMSDQRIHAMMSASIGKIYNPDDGDQNNVGIVGGANRSEAEKNRLRNALKGDIELLGDQHSVHWGSSGAQGAVTFAMGESVVAASKRAYNLAVRKFGKNSKVAKEAERRMNALIRQGLRKGGVGQKEVVTNIAKQMDIKTLRAGKPVAQKELIKQAKNKIMKEIQYPSGKKFLKKFFWSKGAAARWTGRFASGGLQFAYDLMTLPKALDGKITEEEVASLIEDARKSPEYADQPPEFFEELYKSLSPEAQAKAGKATAAAAEEAYRKMAKEKGIDITGVKFIHREDGSLAFSTSGSKKEASSSSYFISPKTGKKVSVEGLSPYRANQLWNEHQ